MFFGKKAKEIRELETAARKLKGKEIRYVSKRDSITYVETILGKNGVIDINEDDELSILCDNKVIFKHNIKGLISSDLMSLNGVILNYKDENGEENEVMVYYKYYRKV